MKKGYRVLLLLVGTIVITLVVTVSLFMFPEEFNGKKITDVISSIASVVSPIIGVLSGYTILELSVKKDNEEELRYNQDMLESLLVYTVMETESLVNNILHVASRGSCDGSGITILPSDLINIDQGFVLVGLGMNRRDWGYSDKQESVQSLLNDSHLSNLVYSDSWDTYLRAINKSEDRLIIAKWLQVLRSNTLKSYNLVVYRDKVIDIIRRAEWINLDKDNIKDTQELLNLLLEDGKEYGLEYKMVVDYSKQTSL